MRLNNKAKIIYEKAQDSAEHYNKMIWTLVSVLFAFSLTALYIYLTSEVDILTKNIILGAGVGSLFYFSFIIEKAHNIKILKYKICKNIEIKYKLIKQNCLVEDLPSKIFKLTGMGILRIGKLLLLFIYLIFFGKDMVIELWRIVNKIPGTNTLYLFSLIAFVIATSFFLVIEFMYFGKDDKEIEKLVDKYLPL